jgi:Mg2+/Co2+ transporter CorB
VLFGDDFFLMADDSIPRCILLIALIIAVGVFSGTGTAFFYYNCTDMKTLAHKGSTIINLITDDKTSIGLLIIINIIYVTAMVSAVLAIGLLGPAGSVVTTVVLALFVFLFSKKHSNKYNVPWES